MKKITSLKHIEEITNGDARVMRELLGVFISEANLQLDKLKRQAAHEEWEELKHTAHKVKSSLALVGMKQYQRLAEELENSAGKNIKKTNQLLNELTAAYNNGITELLNELKKIS